MLTKMAVSGMLLAIGAGCCGPQTPPKASVSDIAVFTSLHLLAAEAGSEVEGQPGGSLNAFNGPFTSAQMKRHFETKSSDYPTLKAHADDLLDGVQGQSAFFQAAQSQFAASVAASFAPKAPTPTQAPAAPVAAPAAANTPTQALEADAKTAFAGLLSSTPNDSPFDHLDRVADFYAGYVVKNLRVRGDSRVIAPAVLAQLLLDALPVGQRASAGELLDTVMRWESQTGEKQLEGDRLILIVFQAQIDAGNQPDKWIGLRLQVKSPLSVKKGEEISVNDVRVIRVHPTHTYDVDLQTYGNTSSAALAFAAQGSGSYSGVGASGNLAQSTSQEASERQRYLSRSSKITSFADGPEHVFGFNFYPSNVRVERSNNPFALLTGSTYATKGYLEGGARDCAAIMIVPRSLDSFDLEVSYVMGDINSGQETVVAPGKHAVHVTLPTWNGLELAAATIGAGPTSFAAPAGSAQVQQQPAPPAPTTQHVVGEGAGPSTRVTIQPGPTPTTLPEKEKASGPSSDGSGTAPGVPGVPDPSK